MDGCTADIVTRNHEHYKEYKYMISGLFWTAPVMLCYVMLCHVMSCHVMSCHVCNSSQTTGL